MGDTWRPAGAPKPQGVSEHMFGGTAAAAPAQPGTASGTAKAARLAKPMASPAQRQVTVGLRTAAEQSKPVPKAPAKPAPKPQHMGQKALDAARAKAENYAAGQISALTGGLVDGKKVTGAVAKQLKKVDVAKKLGIKKWFK